MQPPSHRSDPQLGLQLGPQLGNRPWQQPAAAQLALAPPHWAVAAPSRPQPSAYIRRVAMVVAATCSLAAIARAQVAPGGGSTGGGSTGGGDTGTAAPAGGTGGTGGGGAASDAAPGSLRAQVEAILPGINQPPAGPTTAPAWTFTPSLGVQEEWTDNALQTPTNRQASLITQISPGISLNGASPLLTADLYYAPSLMLYTPQGSQNQVGQTLGTDALLMVSPETFYIKAMGYAGVQSLAGATAANGTAALNQANQIQTYDFSIEPYLTHRFGGWGSVQVGAMAGQTSAGALGGGAAFENLVTKQEFANFASGENFGRLSSSVQLQATQQTGTGALQGAINNTATYQAGYAITHSIIALASVGWEDIRYSGFGAPHYNDATWSIGTQLTPNPDSSIVVSYGHQQGVTDAALNANYAPTTTIRLSAQYSDGITSGAQAMNGALAGATFDALGHPVNSITGDQVSVANNFFGYNAAVFRQRNLMLSASWLLPRDTFQATLSQQTQSPVGNSAGTQVLAVQGNLALSAGIGASSGTIGSLAWQHDLSAALSTNAFLQYGVLSNATILTLTNGVLTATGNQIQNASLLAFGAGLTWQMTPTLTASFQYSYTSNDYGAGNPGVSANLVVLGLQKTF